MSKRNDDNSSNASNIVNKCFPSSTKHDKDDVECLLLNECETNASDQSSNPDENDPLNKSSNEHLDA